MTTSFRPGGPRVSWRCPQCGYRQVEARYLAEVLVDGAVRYEYRCHRGHFFTVAYETSPERRSGHRVAPGD